MAEQFFKGTINFDSELAHNVKRHGLVIKGGKIYRDMVELNGHEIVVKGSENGVYKFIAISPVSIKDRHFLPDWLINLNPLSTKEIKALQDGLEDDIGDGILPIKNNNVSDAKKESSYDEDIIGLKSDNSNIPSVKNTKNTSSKTEKQSDTKGNKLDFIFMEEEEEIIPKKIEKVQKKAPAEEIKEPIIKKEPKINKQEVLIKAPLKEEKVAVQSKNPPLAIDDKIYIATIKFPEFVFDVDGDISFKDGSVISREMVTLEGKILEFYAVRGGFVTNTNEHFFFKAEWLTNVREGTNWALFAKKEVNVFARNSKNEEYILAILSEYKRNNENRFGVINSSKKSVEFYKEVVLVTTKNLAEILKQPPYAKK